MTTITTTGTTTAMETPSIRNCNSRKTTKNMKIVTLSEKCSKEQQQPPTANVASSTMSPSSSSKSTPENCDSTSKWENGVEEYMKQPARHILVKLSVTAATYPIATILIIILLSITTLLIGSMTNFHLELNPDITWSPRGHRMVTHKSYVLEHFAKNSRGLRVLLYPNSNDDDDDRTSSYDPVLHVDRNLPNLFHDVATIHEYMSCAFDIIETIYNTTGYVDSCETVWDQQQNTTTTASYGICPIKSVTGYFNHSRSQYTETTQSMSHEELLKVLSSNSLRNYKGFGNGTPHRTESLVLRQEIYGKPTTADNNNTIQSVAAFVTQIELAPSEDSYRTTTPTSNIEQTVLQRIHTLNDKWEAEGNSICEVIANTDRSDNDELLRGLVNDVPVMVVAFIMMGVFCAVNLGGGGGGGVKKNCCNPLAVESHALVGFGAVFTILLSLCTSFGVLFMFGVPFTSLTIIFPYALLGIGLDDTFIITGSFFRLPRTKTICRSNSDEECKKRQSGDTDMVEQQQEQQLLPLCVIQRIEQTMEHVSVSILATTVTTVLAFALGCFTAIDGIQWFSLYALTSVLIDFLYQITFFIAILVLDDRRINAQRYDCLICYTSNKDTSPSTLFENNTSYSADETAVIIIESKESVDCDSSKSGRIVVADLEKAILPSIGTSSKPSPLVVVSRKAEIMDDTIDDVQLRKNNTEVAATNDSNTNDDDNDIIIPMSARIMDKYVTVLLHPVSQGIVLLLALVMISLGGYAGLQQYQEFDFRDFVPTDSPERIYYDALFTYTDASEYLINKAAVYFRESNITDPEFSKNVGSYYDTLMNNDIVKPTAGLCWLADFDNYLRTENPGIYFAGTLPEQIDAFLNTPPYDEWYTKDISRDDDGNVIVSRCHITLDRTSSFNITRQIETFNEYEKIDADLPVNEGITDSDVQKFFVFTNIFVARSGFALIGSELFLSVGLSLISIVAVSLIFIPHKFGALMLLPTVSMFYVELLGLLYVCGIYINAITAIGLAMSIGLVVDPLLHIALSYWEDDAPGVDRNGRVRNVVTTTGASIFLGSLTTFVGTMFLGMTGSLVFRTFFHIFLGISTLGAIHGLVILPVVLSLVGPRRVGGTGGNGVGHHHDHESGVGQSSFYRSEAAAVAKLNLNVDVELPSSPLSQKHRHPLISPPTESTVINSSNENESSSSKQNENEGSENSQYTLVQI